MIVIAMDGEDASAVAAIIRARGWPHSIVAAGTPLLAAWELAIVAAEGSDLGGQRGGDAADRARAIIAVSDADWIARNDATALGYDQAVDRARLAADLPGAVADWWHAERLMTIERLATTFGTAAVARLLGGLRQLIEQALESADNAATLRSEAHRIAGLAGTLGFAALGRAWLRVADGERPVDDGVRRATHHALATLSQTERKFGAFTAF